MVLVAPEKYKISKFNLNSRVVLIKFLICLEIRIKSLTPGPDLAPKNKKNVNTDSGFCSDFRSPLLLFLQ